MLLTVTLTVCDRPAHLRQVLQNLAANNVQSWRLFCGVEPVLDEALALCESVDFMPCEVVRNPERLGVCNNPYRLLSRVFDAEGADYNVYLEDDVVPSPDALDLARWYISLSNFSEFVCGLFFNYHSDALYPEAVRWTSQFNCLGFVLSRGQWERFFKPHWHDRRGWDWSISEMCRKEGRALSLQPLLSRTTNIGETGTYAEPESHRRTFGGLAASDGSVRQYLCLSQIPFAIFATPCRPQELQKCLSVSHSGLKDSRQIARLSGHTTIRTRRPSVERALAEPGGIVRRTGSA